MWNKLGATRITVLLLITAILFLGLFFLISHYSVGQITYTETANTLDAVATSTAATSTKPVIQEFVVTHVETPEHLKAVYYTSWAAGSKKFRKELFDLIDTTEVNAVVIDVKDYTGRISFMVSNPELVEIGASENRIPDIKEFLGELHKRGIYIIARISAFQDSYLIKSHPEWAVKTKTGEVWHDYKNVKWLDAGAEPVWKYLVSIGREAYSVGFDELNFDYIRFPSDGDLKNVAYDWSEGKSKSLVMKGFFEYLHEKFTELNIPISADLFGLTTSAQDDLGIGQVLAYALPNFDYIYPMVYPSHFGTGFIGYTKPAQHPYEVIKYSMDKAVAKAENASSSPYKIRPWLQAFDLGAIYTPAMVREQIQATYDAGLNSWLLWNAGSVYNKAAFLPKGATTSISYKPE